MNTITVTGNVGKDPEIRYTSAGKAVAKFTVADTRGKGDDKQTQWIRVVAFDEQAENVCEQVKKGARVLVTGRLQIDKYTDKDGVEKMSYDILADDVCLSLKWKPREQDSNPVSIVKATFGGSVEEEPF